VVKGTGTAPAPHALDRDWRTALQTLAVLLRTVRTYNVVENGNVSSWSMRFRFWKSRDFGILIRGALYLAVCSLLSAIRRNGTKLSEYRTVAVSLKPFLSHRCAWRASRNSCSSFLETVIVRRTAHDLV